MPSVVCRTCIWDSNSGLAFYPPVWPHKGLFLQYLTSSFIKWETWIQNVLTFHNYVTEILREMFSKVCRIVFHSVLCTWISIHSMILALETCNLILMMLWKAVNENTRRWVLAEHKEQHCNSSFIPGIFCGAPWYDEVNLHSQSLSLCSLCFATISPKLSEP